MKHSAIQIINARQHNLRGISATIPHRRLTVITGPSGSGKSSLAFDTLYAEGQRRYIESLSTYAKQFLDRMPKPLVDRIDGLAPAVAIEQRTPTMSARSTVGTATEVFDFLRLLWARVGVPHCIQCGGTIRRDTPESATMALLAAASGRVQIGFPLAIPPEATTAGALNALRAEGFLRLLVGDTPYHLDDVPAELTLTGSGPVLVVVDRLVATAAQEGRITEAIAAAFRAGRGVAVAVGEQATHRFTERDACSRCDAPAPALTPTLFSFNHPTGACPACTGFGAILTYDLSLVVPDPTRSLRDGAIAPWTAPRYEGRRSLLLTTARRLCVSADAPWETLPEEAREILLHGKQGRYVGIFPFLHDLEAKRYKQYIRVFLRQYQLAHRCTTCDGTRLRPEARAVTVADLPLGDLIHRTIWEIRRWLADLRLTGSAAVIADHIRAEALDRLTCLDEVGLGYLTLDRQTRTLSGGESQRIALANALGARLVDTLYVLDEPSIGLHPRDTDRLLAILHRLRDQGNTLVVVEHDPLTIAAADWMLELGPGAGEAGGTLLHAGPIDQAPSTLTTDYLSGRKRIGVPSVRRRLGPAWLELRGARLHNLQGVDVKIPLGTLTAITGVSGSGKSTLAHDVLYRQLERRLEGNDSAKRHLGEVIGEVMACTGWETLDAVVLVDQSPIGRTPRSNPVTYIKAFDEIRALFAEQPLARQRRYTPSTFSFNVAGGRCSTCDGAGALPIEMVFLADVFIPCESCGGTRYVREVLDVRVQGASIHDVLQWSIDEAMQRFHAYPRLGATLWHLQQVGLGYLRLGQPATTLSGGEAQRLKIARELLGTRRASGRKLYLLDEPTTGLHLDDVRTLIGVLDRLVDAGHTVIVIEHHLDVIKRADWVIDLGPEAGPAGGQIVAMGTPEDVARVPASWTGKYLREVLDARPS